MAKREEVYLLFDKGLAVDSYEVRSLGLAKSTLRKYHLDWSRMQEEVTPPSPVDTRVPINSLRPQQLFKLEGQTWRLDHLEDTRAYILLAEQAQVEETRVAQHHIVKQGKYITLDTLVEAI